MPGDLPTGKHVLVFHSFPSQSVPSSLFHSATTANPLGGLEEVFGLWDVTLRLLISLINRSGVLGIPFLDVVRVLAAVLLLGNLQFHETSGGGGQCETHEAELKAVAGLLGVTPASLLRGLTMRTHNVRGQLVKSICDANMVWNCSLDPISSSLPFSIMLNDDDDVDDDYY